MRAGEHRLQPGVKIGGHDTGEFLQGLLENLPLLGDVALDAVRLAQGLRHGRFEGLSAMQMRFRTSNEERGAHKVSGACA